MKLLRKIWAIPEAGIFVPLVLLTLVFFCVSPGFLGANSMAAMLRALTFVGIIAVGQTWLMENEGEYIGMCRREVMDAFLRNRAASLGATLVNGLVTVRLGIPAFITTLGMLYVARGLNYLLCQGYPIYPIPDALKQLGRAEPLGLSWAFVIFVLLAAAGDFCLRRTVYGRMAYATGGNAEVARIAGINTQRVQISCYVLTGGMAALAGMLLMSQLNVGQPEIGVGWELDVIASVVIGGVSLFGGVGTVAGTFLGLLLMQVVRSGLVVTGVSTHWQTVAVGVIMVTAVGVDLLRRRTKIS